jgi:hypothetical protein
MTADQMVCESYSKSYQKKRPFGKVCSGSSQSTRAATCIHWWLKVWPGVQGHI